MRTILRTCILAVALISALSGCDKIARQLGPKEVGIVFRHLPRFLGGGLASSPATQASKVFLWPWDELLTVDTTLRTISFGNEGQGFLYTRANDGTEVALKVALSYQVMPDGRSLRELFESVEPQEEKIEALVTVVARSEIRTRFSELETWAFADVERTETVVETVRKAMNSRLNTIGIEVIAVSLSGYQFERLRRDGTLDTRYQDALKTVRDLFEKTQSTKAGVETVRAKKRAELEREQANYNQRLQQAQGLKDQAVNRAGTYFKVKENEAAGIRAAGEAEIEGLRAQIHALAGPGGQALVKLDLVKALMEANPRFVVIPQAKESGEVQVNRIDQNDLLKQLGILEGVRESTKTATPGEEIKK